MQDASVRLTSCIPRLRRYACALLGDSAAADDLVQETIDCGWQTLSSWRRAGDMRAALFQILHNRHLDQLRQPAWQLLTVPRSAALTSRPAPGMRAQRTLEAALLLLPVEQRAVLLLVVLEEMTYAEAAATLGIALGTLMSRLSRARERLRLLMLGQPVSAPLQVIK